MHQAPLLAIAIFVIEASKCMHGNLANNLVGRSSLPPHTERFVVESEKEKKRKEKKSVDMIRTEINFLEGARERKGKKEKRNFLLFSSLSRKEKRRLFFF